MSTTEEEPKWGRDRFNEYNDAPDNKPGFFQNLKESAKDTAKDIKDSVGYAAWRAKHAMRDAYDRAPTIFKKSYGYGGKRKTNRKTRKTRKTRKNRRTRK